MTRSSQSPVRIQAITNPYMKNAPLSMPGAMPVQGPFYCVSPARGAIVTRLKCEGNLATVMTDIDLMVFDFDGTLVQTGRDIAGAVNYAMGALGLPPRDEEAIRGYIGDGVLKLIERALGPERGHLHARALDLFREYYDEHLLDTTALYPGVPEMLEYFRETKKIIVTNKMESFTLKIARGLAIDECFDAIIGRDSGGPVKPDKGVLEPFLEGFAVPNDRTVVIGDGVNDLLLAKNSGVLSCAFLGGLTDRKVLLSLRPDYCCEAMGDLKTLFR